jgi:hypothetical protein
VLIGLMGFFGIFLASAPTSGFYTGPGQLLAQFQVDGVHNLLHLAFGVLGLLAALLGWAASRFYARLVGVIYLLLFLYGAVTLGMAPTMGGFMQLNAADNWLHLIIGLTGLLFGFVPDFAPLSDEPESANAQRW